MKKEKLLLTILIISLPLLMDAQQLVYKPINPAFGGNNTYNYSWLLSSAEAQNKFQEETVGYEQQTELEQFTETLNRQLLNSISQDLFQQEFGDDALGVGTYVFGSLVVDITPTSNGLAINVLDTQTGDQTQIIIPNN